MKTHAAAIRLVIPDNTAETALATLQRLGVALNGLERADLWEFDCEDSLLAAEFLKRVEGIEAIFNLNKHRIHLVKDSIPGPGEIWIGDIEESLPVDSAEVLRQFGSGASAVRHRTAWRLLVGANVASPQTLRRAAEMLLCNPAFQQARYAEATNS